MKQDLKLRVGIIGAGWIAEKAAITLGPLTECEAYAIASRSLDKAEAFAKQWNIPKAYGSYAELIADPDVDLVYVATPHSHHYDVTKQALLAGKPCLVEKAFMANYRQAKEIVDLARERKVFLAEAIWTRSLASCAPISVVVPCSTSVSMPLTSCVCSSSPIS